MKLKTAPRKNRTICIEFAADHEETVKKTSAFREVIDDNFMRHPELFPPEIAEGYELKEIRTSKKTQLPIRRILIKGVSYTIRTSFVMPYMAGMVEDAEGPLFFRKWSVPYWALAQYFGKDPMYWYRLENSLG